MTQIDEKAPLKSITLAALDFETTGMDPIQDEIVEIGIVLFKDKEILSTFEHLVNPGIPISQEAFRVNGIREELLKDEPFIKTLLPDILPFFSNSIPLAHNATFDLAFLLKAVKEEEYSFHLAAVVDSCLLAKSLFPKLSNHRLEFLTRTFGFQSEKAHRALNDAKACFHLFCRCIEEFPQKWETSWEEFRARTSAVLSPNARAFKLPNEFSVIEKAFLTHNQIKLFYQDGKGETTEREVTPVGFTQEKGNSVLVGYCHLRKATRSFRLDRILKVEEVKK